MTRALIGALLSLAIALIAVRVRALSWSGAIAAVLVGTLCVIAGELWAALLIAFFVVTSALSAYGAAEKRARTESVIEKPGPRDAGQVLANGAVYTAAAVGYTMTDELNFVIGGFGALAAAASDSWATEIGTLSRAAPRSITDGRPVPPGTSGGITPLGTLAAIGGAAFISLLSLVAGWDFAVAMCVFLGGMAGSTADSLLGATVQTRRRCIECGDFTERRVHVCGGSTRLVRGVNGLNNDVVNTAATLLGGVIAYLFSLYVLR
jgi:uncharacterized protein (TIGR00297 family)